MKLLIYLVLLCYSTSINAQLNISKCDSSKLPKQIKYSGHFTNAVSWMDNLGLNYVVLTETGDYWTKDEKGDRWKNAALYAYHYIEKGDSIKLLWRIYDYQKDCGFDVNVSFLEKAFKVTDLDDNGIAEVWVMYETQCTSDISPAPTKIIMYEGTAKYAIRGEGKVLVNKENYGGGAYTFDEAFRSGSPFFLKFGGELWKKYSTKQY